MQQQPRLPLWFLVVNWGLIVAAFVLGIVLGTRRSNRLPEPQRSALEIVFQEVRQSYVEPLDEHELLEQAIAGMVEKLDAYSRYIPPAEVAAYDEQNTGHYFGIGAMLASLSNDVVVQYPVPGGPADRAGILPGDRILAVDGEAIDTADERRRVSELVRGPADTEVVLRIARDDGERDVRVRRGDVAQPCVKWVQHLDAEQGLGYLHLTDFHPDAARQVRDAIASLSRERPLRGLVFDLRHDGGGSLDACLSIARMFLRDGVIATQMRREPQQVETYRADPQQCTQPDLPLVLLVDEASASASEVLAGALQDHGRAAVVGRLTYGKGYVNTVYSWQDRAFKLKLTTGSYRTPKGRNIERNHSTRGVRADADGGGIRPDVDVPLTADQQKRVLLGLTAPETPAIHREAVREAARRHGFATFDGPNVTDDPQLAAALQALRERAGLVANSGGGGSSAGAAESRDR